MKESTSGQNVELGKHGYEILGLEQTHQGDRAEPGQVPCSNFSWRNWTAWITVEWGCENTGMLSIQSDYSVCVCSGELQVSQSANAGTPVYDTSHNLAGPESWSVGSLKNK